VALKQKLLVALTAYAVLALLAWQTLSDEPIHIAGVAVQLRLLTVVILGLFAFRTVMAFWRAQLEAPRHRDGE
jgi:hypothetical protein